MFPSVQQLKSPHYFDINYDARRGLVPLALPDPARARALRGAARLPAGHGGGAAPTTCSTRPAPERVSAAMPDARLIVLLRDPVKRAYSNYWERRGSGFEALDTFEAAIDGRGAAAGRPGRAAARRPVLLLRPPRQPLATSPGGGTSSTCARGSRASRASSCWCCSPRSCTPTPAGTLARTHAFLGLPVEPPPDVPHHNRLPVAPMDPGVARSLRDYYRPHNQALAEALGRELPWDA